MPRVVTVLVAAATKHGATREVAERIGTVLAENGIGVHVVDVATVRSVDSYGAVVLGSAVYMGRWLESARSFVDEHAVELAARPTWLFSTGPVGDPPRPDPDDAVKLDEILAATQPRGHRLFGGRIDRDRLGFGERAMMRAVGAAEGDYRDWAAIRLWAAEIAAALQVAEARQV